MSRPPLSVYRAALAGLVFAIVMCTWKYTLGVRNFDELAIRFAVYFGIFTPGFWLLYELLTRNRGAGR